MSRSAAPEDSVETDPWLDHPTRPGVDAWSLPLEQFDVSNPDQPLALQQLDLGNGWTESEFNHHAFLYWPATRQALVPVESWVADLSMGRYVYEAAAVGIKVGSSDLQENGRLRHEIPVDDAEQPVRQEAVRRTFVVGETLYSLSDSGLKASSLDTLEVRGWLGFAP